MVIRDATIRLSIQQVESVIKAPNIAPVVNARKAEQEAAEKSVQANEKVIESLRTEIASLSNAIGRLGSYTAARRAATEADTEAMRSAEELLKRIEEEEKAEEALQRAMEQQTMATLKAGQAVFQFGRGMALLGIANQNVSASVIKTIATAQGLFDVYSSGVKVIKALADVQKANMAATVAARTLNIGLAGSFTLINRAVIGASVAIQTFMKSIGPIGWIAIAVTAAAVAWRKYADAQKAAEEEARATAKAVQDAVEEGQRFYATTVESYNRRAEITRKGEMDQIALLETREEKEAALGAMLKSRGDLEAEISEIQRRSEGSDHEAIKAAYLEREANLLDGQIATNRALVELEREKADAAAKQADAQIQAIQNAQKQVALAQRELDLAKEKERTTAESLGRLDDREFAKIQDIGRRLKAGENVSNADLEAFEKAGGLGKRAASEEFTKRGEGRRKALVGLGFEEGGKSVKQAELEANAAKQAADDAAGGADAEAAIRELEAIKLSAQNEAKEAVKAINELIRELLKDVTAVRVEQEKMRHAATTR